MSAFVAVWYCGLWSADVHYSSVAPLGVTRSPEPLFIARVSLGSLGRADRPDLAATALPTSQDTLQLHIS